jgi:uncharacterized protein
MTDQLPTIREACGDDFALILRLNAQSVHFLSPMSEALLCDLHRAAAYHRVVEVEGVVRAFLLALREGEAYASVNYRWFCARYAQFLYIDRVVVDTAAQGAGLGKILYSDLLAFAGASGVPRVACEFDVDPPNERSRRFHFGFGFREIGTQQVGVQQKKVSLQLAELNL